MAKRTLRTFGFAVLLAMALHGCGGGDSGSAASGDDSTTADSSVSTRRLSGTAPAALEGTVEILTAPYNWSQFSGTRWDNRSLVVIPLDRKIRPKTEGKWYFNPPINLMGPRLDFADAFSVQVAVDVTGHRDKAAFVDLYGTVPIGYDEWRVDGRNVRFGLKDGTAEVWVNMVKQDYSIKNLGPQVSFGMTRDGATLVFSVDGRELGRFEATESDFVFDSGKLYFGVDAELGGGFAITSIKVQGAQVADNGAEMVKAYTPPSNALRTLAAQLPKPLWIGAAANADALLADPLYGKTLARNFSMITPEMHFKFQAIHPRPDQYAFAEADALVAFAAKNNMRVHGHTLVWHESLPQWVWALYERGDRTALRAALMDHVSTVVTRYKGKVNEWDTLNEIFSVESDEPYGLRSEAEDENNPSIWYKSFGLQIYVDVLRKVKEIDPAAENWINEFGIDQTGFADKLANMIAFVKYVNGLGHGKLIDGIGFQSHNYDPDEDPSVASELRAAMKKVISQAQVKVRVSELDVSDASDHASLFSDKLSVCVGLPANLGCDSFGLWGFTDRYGSMSGAWNEDGADNHDSPNWGADHADSLPFDEDYRARPAVSWMRGVLQRALGQ